MVQWVFAAVMLSGLGLVVPVASFAVIAQSQAQSHAQGEASQSKPEVQAPQRDARGRIKRSAVARAQFMRQHPCPATGRQRGPCPGYVIDHIVPLKRGGADRPGNMQWQTVQEAREKDRYE